MVNTAILGIVQTKEFDYALINTIIDGVNFWSPMLGLMSMSNGTGIEMSKPIC